MNQYEELLKQRDARQAELDKLDQDIEAARNVELDAVITQIKTLISTYKIDLKKLFPERFPDKAPRKSYNKGVKAIPRFRDPSTGVTWSGRGKSPRWFDKANPDHFRIPE